MNRRGHRPVCRVRRVSSSPTEIPCRALPECIESGGPVGLHRPLRNTPHRTNDLLDGQGSTCKMSLRPMHHPACSGCERGRSPGTRYWRTLRTVCSRPTAKQRWRQQGSSWMARRAYRPSRRRARSAWRQQRYRPFSGLPSAPAAYRALPRKPKKAEKTWYGVRRVDRTLGL